MRFIPRVERNLLTEGCLTKNIMLLQILFISYDWFSSVTAAKRWCGSAVYLLIDHHGHKNNFFGL